MLSQAIILIERVLLSYCVSSFISFYLFGNRICYVFIAKVYRYIEYLLALCRDLVLKLGAQLVQAWYSKTMCSFHSQPMHSRLCDVWCIFTKFKIESSPYISWLVAFSLYQIYFMLSMYWKIHNHTLMVRLHCLLFSNLFSAVTWLCLYNCCFLWI